MRISLLRSMVAVVAGLLSGLAVFLLLFWIDYHFILEQRLRALPVPYLDHLFVTCCFLACGIAGGLAAASIAFLKAVVGAVAFGFSFLMILAFWQNSGEVNLKLALAVLLVNFGLLLGYRIAGRFKRQRARRRAAQLLSFEEDAEGAEADLAD